MGIKVQLVEKGKPEEVVGTFSIVGGKVEAACEDPEIQSSVDNLVRKYVPAFPKGSRASQKVQDAARVLGFFRVLDLLKVAGLGVKAKGPSWVGGRTEKARLHLFERMTQDEQFRGRLRPAALGEVTFSKAIKQYMKEEASDEERRLYERASVYLGII